MKQKFVQVRTNYICRILQLCLRTNVRPIKNGFKHDPQMLQDWKFKREQPFLKYFVSTPKPPENGSPSPQKPTLTTAPHQLTRVVGLAEGVDVLVMPIAVLVLVMMLMVLKVLVGITAVFVMATKHVFFFLEWIIIKEVPKIKVHTSTVDLGIGIGSPSRTVTIKMKATENVILNIVEQVIKIEEIAPAESEGVLVVVVEGVSVMLSLMPEVLVKALEKFIEVE